ncbi:dihydroxyacetone kinase [Niveomyces insectorum RCEF 264]|uniref:Dihydroxyacetone kinase n=1 Tax=Niveomyces insectorum RCEF 264 TaxID=1081102 RepID=A0A168AHI6_9HYPO|nr:dihydroxyacetone kinase [Niveomyces insectorum RCEF 264]
MASSAKHFVNDPTLLVNTALRAVTYTNPAVALDEEHKIIYRRPTNPPPAKPSVSIVSGGGSGHEPSFAAMVGPGLLTASVAGTIFASPSAEQIRTAISGRVPHDAGVLVTVMNYTGDVLNFGMAVEKARAAGVPVEMVVVADDVSGALAARGYDLASVAGVARLAADNLVSVGASLAHVHVPGRREDSEKKDDDDDDALRADEVEIGMGIHNEPGSARVQGVALPALVSTMLRQLLDPADADRAFVRVPATAGGDVVLLVNNLGGVSVLELGAITAEVVAQLARDWHIRRPVRVLSGTYMTSLNGLGFSISLLNVVDTGLGPDGPTLLQLLDDPAEATGWAAPISAATWDTAAAAQKDAAASATSRAAVATSTSTTTIPPSGLHVDPTVFRTALARGLTRVVDAEPEITQYDTVVGDGDCGTGMKRGAEALLEHLSSSATGLTGDAVVDVANLVPVVERSMDGTSGALYAIFLNALVHALRQQAAGATAAAAGQASVDWAAALRQSCATLARYTPARGRGRPCGG